MNKQSFIYKLLEIKPSSGKMLLILLPPVYALWLLAMGKALLRRQNRSDKVFTVFASATAIAMFVCFVIVPLLAIFGIDISVRGPKAIPIILPIYFFWFGTLGILTRVTVKYDRDAKPGYHYSLISSLDFVKRFFAFFYWPFTMWFLQKQVHEYSADGKPSG